MTQHRDPRPEDAPKVLNDIPSKSKSSPARTDSPQFAPTIPAPDQIVPWATASAVSRFFFFWVTPLVRRGWRSPLQQSDLWRSLGPVMDADRLADEFDQELQREFAKRLVAEGAGKRDKPGLAVRRAMWTLYFRALFPAGFLNLTCNICLTFSPLVVKSIIQFAQRRYSGDPNATLAEGFLLVIALFFLQLLSALLMPNFVNLTQVIGLKVRTALSALIYRKSLRLSAAARRDFSSGRVISMVAVDCARIELFLMFVNVFWTSPFNISLMLGFLFSQIGWSAICGVGILLLIIPIQGYIFRTMTRVREAVAPLTDKRVKITTEILSGIRIIKFFAWEVPFLERIESIRNSEMGVDSEAVDIHNVGANVYSTYNVLDAATVFSALSWFSMLQGPLSFYPQLINSWADFHVAIARIEDFLVAPELDEQSAITEDSSYAVRVSNGEFVWEVLADAIVETPATAAAAIEMRTQKNVATPTLLEGLQNVNLNIEKGSFVAIVGAVGSGKSSLLNAILGEMKRVKGEVLFSGTTGYAPQSAWIQNATLKENILFGRPYDETRYKNTIRTCCLEPDLRVLPQGDQTAIGERGINLSGGQKQRVNLARLVYSDPDIVLMDDPLSAVDAHVGRALYNNCFQGALKGKTRILVTHQVHLLSSEIDHVILMKNGAIAEQGSFNDLMKLRGGEFAQMMANFGNSKSEDEKESSKKSDEKGSQIVENAGIEKKPDAPVGSGGMAVEEREIGAVASHIWWSYIRAMGGTSFLMLGGLMILLMQGSALVSNLWLSWWASGKFDYELNTENYMEVYIGLGVLNILGTLFYGLVFAFGATKAARLLQESALSRVIRAPTSFFDTNPLGRIVNRFSKDQDVVDNTLLASFVQTVTNFGQAVTTFSLIVASTPLFSIPLVPIMGIYYILQRIYRTTARELKRIDSISRSPLYASFGETLTGLPTIRAYRQEARFITQNTIATNANNVPYFCLFQTQMWFSFRLGSISAVLVFFAAAFGVLGSSWLSPAILGLSLTYALQVTQVLTWGIRQFTDLEVAMNSVERMDHYAKNIDNEAAPVVEDHRPPPGWPSKGTIEFKDLEMRYAPELPLVVKGVSFEVGNAEKIGIVGRTGSGKSSLMQALFRIVEPCSGSIIIDGVDICQIGLSDLRKGIAIIPQDPILFTGTFRSNLDPFNEHQDSELWDALDRAGLKPKIQQSSDGLDGKVDDGGENLSVGERQLVCLARAMLKKPRILIMDEATANVDFSTDDFIQKALRKHFKDASILTIAHRLNTIIDYDRILVLDGGVVSEYATPRDLLADNNSRFYGMVAETGPSNLQLLKGMVL
ncbi:P-loop containing nucleoside triphosphate hydrolase protein [Obelidium mucronatum]|nr:P-loop containing nucleoside triphosphate hydrolase protein [Obelidium mucronatum]